jgi:hypothetical protein
VERPRGKAASQATQTKEKLLFLEIQSFLKKLQALAGKNAKNLRLQFGSFG